MPVKRLLLSYMVKSIDFALCLNQDFLVDVLGVGTKDMKGTR